MKLGILQTGLVPDELAANHGQYPQMFARAFEKHGFDTTGYAVVNGELPKKVDEQEGWIISGSRHGAYEDHPWIPLLEAFIRDVHTARVPMVGICFGHQIMAQALGGKVEKFNGGWNVGNTTYQHSNDHNDDIKLIALHQDQIVEPPTDAQVVMSSEFCKYAGLSYSDTMMSVQPHPEFTPDFARDIVTMRRGHIIPIERADPALAAISENNQSEEMIGRLAGFLHGEGYSAAR